jgi:hypothetical protein
MEVAFGNGSYELYQFDLNALQNNANEQQGANTEEIAIGKQH